MRLDVFFFRTKTGSLTCVWWVLLTERLQTGAVSLQKPTIVWLFQDLRKLPSQLAKHRFNNKAAVILACVESVSNRAGYWVIPLIFLFCFAVVPTFLTNSRGNACYAGYRTYSDLKRQTFTFNLRERKVARKGIQFSLIRTLLSYRINSELQISRDATSSVQSWHTSFINEKRKYFCKSIKRTLNGNFFPLY